MSRLVSLDSGPLSLIANPRGEGEALLCQAWAREMLAAGVRVLVPEIADYETRRELIRAEKAPGLARLDRLKIGFEYVPITTEAMQRAAELWAIVRQLGIPTASAESLDGDCILAAQTLLSARPGDEVLVATTNPEHLGRFPGNRRPGLERDHALRSGECLTPGFAAGGTPVDAIADPVEGRSFNE